MEETIRLGSGLVVVCVETLAAMVIAYGTVEAVIALAPVFVGKRPIGWQRNIRRQFGVWLLLGLEFELAADIVRSAMSPSWTDIGQLASIAVIRTVLNYFLETEVNSVSPAPGRVRDA
jgi:uncharacterized membrane protein